MFNIVEDEIDGNNIYCQTHNHYIPLDPANRHYQEVLDAIIEQGAACFDGDIPEELQEVALISSGINSEAAKVSEAAL